MFFYYILILYSIVFEFGVSLTHLTYHYWFENMNITIAFLTPSYLVICHETRFEIHFDMRGLGSKLTYFFLF